VNNKKVAPKLVNSSATFNENASFNLDLLAAASDANGKRLTVYIVTRPTHGTLVQNPDGAWIYTPDLYFFGIDSFTYMVSDGVANSNIATVKLNVSKIAPNAVHSATTLSVNTPLVLAKSNLNDVNDEAIVIFALLTVGQLPVLQADGSRANAGATLKTAIKAGRKRPASDDHGRKAILEDETRHDRFPPLQGAFRQSRNRSQGAERAPRNTLLTLNPLPKGEEANERLRGFHINRRAPNCNLAGDDDLIEHDNFAGDGDLVEHGDMQQTKIVNPYVTYFNNASGAQIPGAAQILKPSQRRGAHSIVPASPLVPVGSSNAAAEPMFSYFNTLPASDQNNDKIKPVLDWSANPEDFIFNDRRGDRIDAGSSWLSGFIGTDKSIKQDAVTLCNLSVTLK
jgi:hypothetical protein